MNRVELDRTIKQAPHGHQKMVLLRKAWELADKEKNYEAQIDYRIEYMSESCFYDDTLEIFIIYPEILKLNDQYVKEHGYDPDPLSILWCYKWLLDNAKDFYQISIEQFELFFEDCKKRFLRNGFSLRPLYQHKYAFYLRINKDIAKDAYAEFVNCERDDMCDCHACERSTEVKFFLVMNELGRAVSKAAPLIDGQLSCEEEPENTLGEFLEYYNEQIALGERDYVEPASELCETLRRSIERKGIVPFRIPQVLLFYALENPTKALNYYKKNWSFYEECRNPVTRYWFAIATLCFLNNLGDKKTYKMKMSPSYPFYNVNDVYDVEILRKYYKDAALDIARKMDKRNRTTAFTDRFNLFLGEK